MSFILEKETEWFVPDPSVEVRQGDLLVSRSPSTDRIEELCLVITADCDISKGKFGRQLACLRVLSLDEYIKTVWATKKLERIQKSELETLTSQVVKWHTRLLGSESALTPHAVSAWVDRDDPKTMCEQLNVPEEDRKRFSAALSTFKKALADLGASATRDKLTQYVAYRAVVRNQDLQQCRQRALSEAQNEALPDDVFLLTSLPQISDDGAVVLLREIVGISYEDVCYRTADATKNDSLLRVGRLHPTFKYAISQAFGALYSKIGLPADYETRCKNAVAALANI